MKRNNNKGFTLAELLIVVAVIAVLVAVAIPTFTNQLEKSRQAVDVSNLRGAYAAARLAEIDQAVDGETFKAVIDKTENGTAEEKETYKYGLSYWYDPDSAGLTRVVTASGASADDITADIKAHALGKATSQKVVTDTSQLPGGNAIVYSPLVLRQGTAGSTDKRILVTFQEDTAKNGVYVIDQITFVSKLETWDKDATPRAVPGISLTITDNDGASAQGGVTTYTAENPLTFTFKTADGQKPYKDFVVVSKGGLTNTIEAATAIIDNDTITINLSGNIPAYDAEHPSYPIVVTFKDAEGNTGKATLTLTVTSGS